MGSVTPGNLKKRTTVTTHQTSRAHRPPPCSTQSSPPTSGRRAASPSRTRPTMVRARTLDMGVARLRASGHAGGARSHWSLVFLGSTPGRGASRPPWLPYAATLHPCVARDRLDASQAPTRQRMTNTTCGPAPISRWVRQCAWHWFREPNLACTPLTPAHMWPRGVRVHSPRPRMHAACPPAAVLRHERRVPSRGTARRGRNAATC